MKKIIFAFVIFGLAGCGEIHRYSGSSAVGAALKERIRDEHRSEVVLKELTHFDWDEFFLFNPYAPTTEICQALDLDAAECKNTIKYTSTADDEMLLVFRYHRKIVHVEMHSRWNGDFTPAPRKPFTPASAVFMVVPDGRAANGGEWLRLRPKSQP